MIESSNHIGRSTDGSWYSVPDLRSNFLVLNTIADNLWATVIFRRSPAEGCALSSSVTVGQVLGRTRLVDYCNLDVSLSVSVRVGSLDPDRTRVWSPRRRNIETGPCFGCVNSWKWFTLFSPINCWLRRTRVRNDDLERFTGLNFKLYRKLRQILP